MLPRLPLATVLALAALTPFVGIQAQAQKPALTKDVDANGRTPYMQTITGNQSSFCTQLYACTLTFNAVPAGYRLVVTYTSEEFVIEGGSPSVVIGNGQTGSSAISLAMPTPTVLNPTASFQNCIVSAPVTFYVEPGAKPTVTLLAQSSFSIYGEGTFRITLIGYLISTP